MVVVNLEGWIAKTNLKADFEITQNISLCFNIKALTF